MNSLARLQYSTATTAITAVTQAQPLDRRQRNPSIGKGRRSACRRGGKSVPKREKNSCVFGNSHTAGSRTAIQRQLPIQRGAASPRTLSTATDAFAGNQPCQPTRLASIVSVAANPLARNGTQAMTTHRNVNSPAATLLAIDDRRRSLPVRARQAWLIAR